MHATPLPWRPKCSDCGAAIAHMDAVDGRWEAYTFEVMACSEESRQGWYVGGAAVLHEHPPEDGRWHDTFDDGWRAASVSLIHLHRHPPSWLPRRHRWVLRRFAWPLVFQLLESYRVNGDPHGRPRPRR